MLMLGLCNALYFKIIVPVYFQLVASKLVSDDNMPGVYLILQLT